MRARFFRRESEIERRLRKARPQASEELIERLMTRIESEPAPRPRRRGSRLAVAGALTALMAAALALTGGIGYAASTVTHVVQQVTHQSTDMGSRMTLAVKQNSASTDQYGQSSNATTSSVDNAIAKATARGATTATITIPATPGSSTTAATVSIPTSLVSTLPAGSELSVDPTPPSAPTSIGSNNLAVSIKIVSNGVVVHPSLPVPVAVTLDGPFGSQYVPCIDKQDGNGCAAVTALSGPQTSCPLGNGKTDGYYHSGNDIVIETCHLTIFAVVYKGNLSVSESGRKLKKAGSGLFGDPELIAPGAAQLKQVGGSVQVYPFHHLSGKAVRFRFFVNEQVAAYIQLFRGSKRVAFDLHGTMVRGSTLSKQVRVKTLHVPVLKPGTLPIRLRVPGLEHGVHYRIRVSVLDYDGHKTVRYIPFTG